MFKLIRQREVGKMPPKKFESKIKHVQLEKYLEDQRVKAIKKSFGGRMPERRTPIFQRRS